MHSVIQAFYKQIQFIFTPSFCVYCRKWLTKDTIFCSYCIDLIQPIVSTKIMVTPTVAMAVFALSSYQEPLKSLILAKAQSQRLASRQLGTLMWERLPLPTMVFDYIVPVPLHWTRYAHRGYNQAEEMALIIAQKSNKPLTSLLKRTKRTVFQSQLESGQRMDNVADAFALSGSFPDLSLYHNKHLLLVDDLLTTGSTIKAAAKVLLKLKPASINVVVACRII